MKIITKTFIALFLINSFLAAAYAQGALDTNQLTRNICQAKSDSADNGKYLSSFDQLKDSYFKDRKYSEFTELLKKGLCPGNKLVEALSGYYIALSRYEQLKYLEASKNWDEYFAKANDYRDDILNGAVKTINGTKIDDPINIRSRIILFQLHKDLQDNFVDEALADLMNSINEYAQSKSNIEVIREAADKLSAYDEKNKSRELYKLYSRKLVSSDMQPEALKVIALDYYKSDNIELAENIYNIYIEKISKVMDKDKLAQELKDIAVSFAYRENSGIDVFYAEEIFAKVEAIAGKDVFDEETLYLRAFNLEKSKAYPQAKDVYTELVKRFPESKHCDEAIYKIACIYAYILRDIKSSRTYFEKLAHKDSLSSQSLASLYQLGLLKQWESEAPAARKYYNKLLEKIGDGDQELLAALKSRMQELEENRTLDYNLKTALDAALKEDYANIDLGKMELKANLYNPPKGAEVIINSSAYIGSSGCLQVDLRYLWSGDLGGAQPNIEQSEVKTSYKSSGTKLINVVLISPTGITSRSIDFIDVR
jgi:hypothetical protein